MIKDVKHYFKSGNPVSYYVDGRIEEVAFIFLATVYAIFCMIIWLVLFVTGPLWIIPYLIFKQRKQV